MEYHEISSCFSDAASRTVYAQRPSWRSCSDKRIFEMLQHANINCSASYLPATLSDGSNIIENISLQRGIILRIKSKMKMLGFYKFRQSTERLSLLAKIHNSIRPSLRIRNAVQR